MNSRSGTIGPPNPPLAWFCVRPAPNGDAVASPQASDRWRATYVSDPSGVLVPLLVVAVTRPPENWPRATSYVLVTTRVERNASAGTVPVVPNPIPSSVTLLAVVRWPATENALVVESLAVSGSTPGARAATAFKSVASTGSRAI